MFASGETPVRIISTKKMQIGFFKPGVLEFLQWPLPLSFPSLRMKHRIGCLRLQGPPRSPEP